MLISLNNIDNTISKFHYYLLYYLLPMYLLIVSFNHSCVFILVLYCFLFCFPDHQSTAAVTDNEDNLLRNVSNCIKSLNIKQDYRVDNLQGQDNKQSRKRQIEANTSGEEISGIYAPILFIHLILSFVQ